MTGGQLSTSAVVVYVLAGGALAYGLHRYREVAFRGIPDLSATGLGLFRIVFGVALLYGMGAALALPDGPAPGGDPAQADLWAPWGWVEYLTTHADTLDALQVLTLVAIVLFTVGLAAELSFMLVLVGFVVRLLVAQEYGAVSHAWVIFPLVLLPLVVVPWGDGLSVDNVIRRRQRQRRPDRPAGPHYGIAIWLPGLTLGCVWLAAAGAKIGVSGLDWITGGAVRYHWAEDHLNAPSSLGAWIAGHETIAILCSGVGVAIEALFITHVLFRSQRARLAYGLVALALFGGFYLFQGVFWYAWWVVLLAFLPWEAMANIGRRMLLRAQARRDDRRVLPVLPRPESLRTLTPALAVVVALLLTQQFAVSKADVEQMPFVSNYPMYATTWPSPDAFNRAMAPVKFYRYEFRDPSSGGEGQDITARLDEANLGSVLRDAAGWRLGHAGVTLDPVLQRGVEAVPIAYERRFKRALRAVRIRARRRVFDFDEGKLVTVEPRARLSVHFDPVRFSRTPTR